MLAFVLLLSGLAYLSNEFLVQGLTLQMKTVLNDYVVWHVQVCNDHSTPSRGHYVPQELCNVNIVEVW